MANKPLDLNILPEPQLLLWKELSATPPEFVLYGGTAIALQLGHRESIESPIPASNSIKIASLLDLLASKCSTVQQRAEWKDYTDIATILEETDISLSEGIGAACAIFGERFNPMASLKALVYTRDIKPELRSDQVKLIRDQVVEAELGGFPSYQPVGPIGTFVKNATTPGRPGSTQ